MRETWAPARIDAGFLECVRKALKDDPPVRENAAIWREFLETVIKRAAVSEAARREAIELVRGASSQAAGRAASRTPLEAYELIERFAVMSTEGGMDDFTAAGRLLERYPPNRESCAVWRELLCGIDTMDDEAKKLIEAFVFLAEGPQEAVDIEAEAKRRAGLAGTPRGEPSHPRIEIEAPPKPQRERLADYLVKGVPLYAEVDTPDGRRYRDWRTGIWRQEAAVIRTVAELDSALEAGVILFVLNPQDGGWLALDMDRGHATGKDGFESWKRFREEHGIDADFLEIPTTRVSTPSGGMHVYFTDWSKTERYKHAPFEGVEVFGRGIKSTLTAAGSVRKGKLYELEGNLSEAAALPIWLVGLIAEREPCLDEARARSEPPKKPRASFGKAQAIAGKQGRARYTLEQLVTWGLEDAKEAGLLGERNWQAFYVGRSVGSAYPVAEIEAECWRRAEFADRRDFSEREMRRTIESGIRRSSHK